MLDQCLTALVKHWYLTGQTIARADGRPALRRNDCPAPSRRASQDPPVASGPACTPAARPATATATLDAPGPGRATGPARGPQAGPRLGVPADPAPTRIRRPRGPECVASGAAAGATTRTARVRAACHGRRCSGVGRPDAAGASTPTSAAVSRRGDKPTRPPRRQPSAGGWLRGPGRRRRGCGSEKRPGPGPGPAAALPPPARARCAPLALAAAAPRAGRAVTERR